MSGGLEAELAGANATALVSELKAAAEPAAVRTAPSAPSAASAAEPDCG